MRISAHAAVASSNCRVQTSAQLRTRSGPTSGAINSLSGYRPRQGYLWGTIWSLLTQSAAQTAKMPPISTIQLSGTLLGEATPLTGTLLGETQGYAWDTFGGNSLFIVQDALFDFYAQSCSSRIPLGEKGLFPGILWGEMTSKVGYLWGINTDKARPERQMCSSLLLFSFIFTSS